MADHNCGKGSCPSGAPHPAILGYVLSFVSLRGSVERTATRAIGIPSRAPAEPCRAGSTLGESSTALCPSAHTAAYRRRSLRKSSMAVRYANHGTQRRPEPPLKTVDNVPYLAPAYQHVWNRFADCKRQRGIFSQYRTSRFTD